MSVGWLLGWLQVQYQSFRETDHQRCSSTCREAGKEYGGMNMVEFHLSVILPGTLTENTFSFAATTWGIVTGERNKPIVNWR